LLRHELTSLLFRHRQRGLHSDGGVAAQQRGEREELTIVVIGATALRSGGRLEEPLQRLSLHVRGVPLGEELRPMTHAGRSFVGEADDPRTRSIVAKFLLGRPQLTRDTGQLIAKKLDRPLRLEAAFALVTNDVKLTKGVRDCIDKSGVRATYAHVDDIGVPAAPRYGRPRSDRVHGVIDWKNREVQWRLRQRRG